MSTLPRVATVALLALAFLGTPDGATAQRGGATPNSEVGAEELVEAANTMAALSRRMSASLNRAPSRAFVLGRETGHAIQGAVDHLADRLRTLAEQGVSNPAGLAERGALSPTPLAQLVARLAMEAGELFEHLLEVEEPTELAQPKGVTASPSAEPMSAQERRDLEEELHALRQELESASHRLADLQAHRAGLRAELERIEELSIQHPDLYAPIREAVQTILLQVIEQVYYWNRRSQSLRTEIRRVEERLAAV